MTRLVTEETLYARHWVPTQRRPTPYLSTVYKGPTSTKTYHQYQNESNLRGNEEGTFELRKRFPTYYYRIFLFSSNRR